MRKGEVKMKECGKKEAGSYVTQISRIVNVELRKLLKNDSLSATETGVIMCTAIGIDTAGQIARYMGVSRSLMSKTVENLVRGGWIETKPDENDRRVVHLCLLPKAEPAAAHCCDLRERFFTAMMEGVSPEDMEVFNRVSKTFSLNLEKFVAEETARAKAK